MLTALWFGRNNFPWRKLPSLLSRHAPPESIAPLQGHAQAANTARHSVQLTRPLPVVFFLLSHAVLGTAWTAVSPPRSCLFAPPTTFRRPKIKTPPDSPRVPDPSRRDGVSRSEMTGDPKSPKGQNLFPTTPPSPRVLVPMSIRVDGDDATAPHDTPSDCDDIPHMTTTCASTHPTQDRSRQISSIF